MDYKKIKTVEAAFKACGLNPKNLPGVSKLPKKFAKWLIDGYTLAVVIQALNMEQGKVYTPDYTDDNWKYEARFGIEANAANPGGVGFSSACYDGWNSVTTVGSLLVFRDYARLSHAQKYFEDVFKGYLLNVRKEPRKTPKKAITKSKTKK